MESLKHESGSVGLGGSRRVDNGRSAVFVVEHGGHWADSMLALRRWLNDTGRGRFQFSNRRDL
jgi:hypothetical protein